MTCVVGVDGRRAAPECKPNELAAGAAAGGSAALQPETLRTDAPFVPRTQHRFP